MSKDDSNLGCCSMVIWDSIAAFGFTFYFFSQVVQIHTVFCILLGLAAVVLVMVLMAIPVVGRILQVLAGLGWVAGLYYIAETFNYTEVRVGGNTIRMGWMSALYNKDPIWYWFIVIAAILLFVGLHLASFKITGSKKEDDKPESVELSHEEYEEILSMPNVSRANIVNGRLVDAETGEDIAERYERNKE